MDLDLDKLTQDFENVRRRLAVRLHPIAEARSQSAGIIWEERIPGLAAVLVYDFPDLVAPVLPTHAAQWKRSTAELLDLGILNVKKQGPLGTGMKDYGGGIRVGFVADAQGENLFATTHAFFLEDYLKPPPALGCLVGLPQRRALIFMPLESRRPLAGADLFAGSIRDLYQAGPDALTPQLYWWKAGTFTPLTVSGEGSELRVRLPEGLQASS